ncbi:MAG: hypothetical protein QGH83_05270, partial [Candidatus Pacebacteria bacterium]|nr:hypothetical protein [Candidatus Paceibacterota bacterium]
MKNNYDKKFSIAHYDASEDDNLFLECFENSSEQYRNEIYDIYFGTVFLHRDVTYGETMGVTASPAQYKNLLKIQEKYGIPISLTLNEMNRPMEMLRGNVIKEFVSFIKKYYDDGVRSCTISHTHLMRTGALQEAFPDMNWKNTVNHRITTTQEFLDYAQLGYNIIQLDRNYNRNLNELKRTKKEADRLGVKTCLLIKEGCMPECPFKTEHDCWQGGSIRYEGKSYWDIVPFTCNTWRGTHAVKEVHNPRAGTDIMIHSKEDWDDFAEKVDVFKLSGRLQSCSGPAAKFGYYLEMWKDPEKQDQAPWPNTHMFEVSSFKDVYENNLTPFHMWFRSL